MPHWFTRSRELAAANLLGFLCTLVVILLVPGFAAVTRVVREPGTEGAFNAWAQVRDQVGATLRRDWWLGLAMAVTLALGAISTLTAFGYLDGTARLVATALSIVLHLGLITMIITYAHSAGTLPVQASREKVATLTLTRLARSPGRAMVSALVLVACAPMWVFAPVALAIGIIVPAWALTRIWASFDAQVDWSDDEVAAA